MSFTTILQEKAAAAGFALTETQLAQLTTYYEMVIATNKVMNLTNITEPADFAVKHVVDSLLCYERSMKGKNLADVGTGAGFPGVVLKIYDPSVCVTLVDSLAKRLGFLDSVVARLGLRGIITVHARAEEAGQSPALRESFDVVTARAVAPLPVLAEYCLPLVKPGGVFYALKGAKVEEEVEAATRAVKLLGGKLAAVEEKQLPGLEDRRVIVKIKKTSLTPKAYPRKAGTPAKKPL